MTKKEQLVEVARSFSFKLNVGNYESRDFFCSQKCECKEEDAETKSEALYDFCRAEVEKSVNKYLKEKEIQPVKMTEEGQGKIDDFREKQKTSWNDGERETLKTITENQ